MVVYTRRFWTNEAAKNGINVVNVVNVGNFLIAHIAHIDHIFKSLSSSPSVFPV